MTTTNSKKFTIDDIEKLLSQFQGISISSDLEDDLLHTVKIPSGDITIPAMPPSFMVLTVDQQETFVSLSKNMNLLQL